MPPLSLKKIGLVLLSVIALSRLDRIFAALGAIHEASRRSLTAICGFFREALAPFFNGPIGGRFAVAVALLALFYVTAFRILHDRYRR